MFQQQNLVNKQQTRKAIVRENNYKNLDSCRGLSQKVTYDNLEVESSNN